MAFSALIFLSIALGFDYAPGAYHVVIDPGHGGHDRGATYGSTKEADLVLSLSQQLKNLLEKDPQLQVTLTRTTDVFLSLPARVEFAEKQKADLFVSIHANAAVDPRARGVEFFFQNNLPPDEDSLFLAHQENQLLVEKIDSTASNDLSKKGDITAIVEDLQRQNRIHQSFRLTQALTNVWESDANAAPATIKQAPFYVVSKTSMPAVLIEVGFLSHPQESKKLISASYQNTLVQKIYSALNAFKEKSDNRMTKTLN